MALFRGIGARKDADRGTAPIEVRKVLAGLFTPTTGIGARSGILFGAASPLVTGDATWAYNVGIFHAYVSRTPSDGGQIYGNDGSVLIGATGVGTTVPITPSAGLQRIDIIWTRHPTNTENTDTASEPLFGVASGADAVVAVAPVIPAGAIELARNLITDAATSTVSAGNTITQTVLYTALRGAPVPVRTQAERDALNLYDGLQVYRLDTHLVEIYESATWVSLSLSAYATLTGVETLEFKTLVGPTELSHIAGAAPSAAQNIDSDTSQDWIFDVNATVDWVFNLRASAAIPLDTRMSVGHTKTFSCRVKQGATAYKTATLKIDGTLVTLLWVGTAPTAGDINAYDLYTFAVTKTAASTYLVFAQMTKVS